MKNFTRTVSKFLLLPLAVVLMLGALPAQLGAITAEAAKPNFVPAISFGPLSHRTELTATVNAKAKLTKIELRVDAKKVQPWVKAHANWKYTIKLPLNNLTIGGHTVKLQVWNQKNQSAQRQWQFQKLAALALSSDTASIMPGGKVTITGQGFTPGSAVSIGLGGQNMGVGGDYGRATVDTSGTFTTDVTLDNYPDGSALHAGIVTLVAHNADGSEKASTELRILPNPKVSTDQSIVKPGSQLRLAGEGYTPGVTVTVGLGDANGNPSGSYGSAVTDSAGMFAVSVRLQQLPDGSPIFAGPLTLIAQAANGAERASVTIQVAADPSLSANKTLIRPNETVIFTGTGFSPGKVVILGPAAGNTGHGDRFASTNVDGSGRFTFALSLSRYPDGTLLPPGRLTLMAFTADGERATVGVQIAATPNITLNTSTVKSGDSVTVSGQGFTPGGVVSISLGPVNGGAGGNYGSVIVDANGAFTLPVTLARYPDGSALNPGTIVVVAHTADSVEKASVQLQIAANPALSLDRTNIQVGDRVVVIGQGFTPGKRVFISPGGVSPVSGGTYGTALVDAGGRFSVTVTLDRYPNGVPIGAGPLALVAHTAAWEEAAQTQVQVVDRVPLAPTKLNITALVKGVTSTEHTLAGLQWQDNSTNETGFHITATFTRQNRGADTQSWTTGANATSAQVSFVAGGINPVTGVCFTVTAFNAQGSSSPSTPACAAL